MIAQCTPHVNKLMRPLAILIETLFLTMTSDMESFLTVSNPASSTKFLLAPKWAHFNGSDFARPSCCCIEFLEANSDLSVHPELISNDQNYDDESLPQSDGLARSYRQQERKFGSCKVTWPGCCHSSFGQIINHAG